MIGIGTPSIHNNIPRPIYNTPSFDAADLRPTQTIIEGLRAKSVR